jgi:preprotein translocase subunit SecE
MTMNREQRRMLQRQGEIGADGEPIRARRQAPAPKPKDERTKPLQFVKEVRSELKKVVWPTRQETVNYSVVTLVTIVFFTALIAGLDWVFSGFVLRLFKA